MTHSPFYLLDRMLVNGGRANSVPGLPYSIPINVVVRSNWNDK
jgi:hypothetical protein